MNTINVIFQNGNGIKSKFIDNERVFGYKVEIYV